jgi:hypothetical protein
VPGERGRPDPRGRRGRRRGNPDPGDPNTPTEYAASGRAGALARIDALGGASGPNGEFVVGDTVTVDFSLEKADGKPWKLAELTAGEALVSGPTTNYQRVLPSELDVAARATQTSAGHFRFTFASSIPAAFAPPYNDSPSFGQSAGELSGLSLRDGTYTLGLSVAWDYTVAGRPFRRVGEATLVTCSGPARALSRRAR